MRVERRDWPDGATGLRRSLGEAQQERPAAGRGHELRARRIDSTATRRFAAIEGVDLRNADLDARLAHGVEDGPGDADA
jgi:hypothetical protein